MNHRPDLAPTAESEAALPERVTPSRPRFAGHPLHAVLRDPARPQNAPPLPPAPHARPDPIPVPRPLGELLPPAAGGDVVDADVAVPRSWNGFSILSLKSN